MQELETQLLSWAPRRPSARLKKRLFLRGRGDAPTPFGFQWLVPATAALLFVGLVFNQRNSSAISGSSSSTPMVAMIMSNQSAAAYLPGSFTRDQNILSADTFDWTNGSSLTSSISSLSSVKGTN